MKPSEFIKMYTLFDSLVEDLKYNEVEKQLKLTLELCQWKQSFYVETEPEMQLGILIFSDVTFYKTEPQLFNLDSSEILEVDLLPCDGEDECIKMVLNGLDDVIVLSIQSNEVEWKEIKTEDGQ
ncbi:hypothetical protein P4H71_11625 [Paenibacillus kribbensis]|uniref:Uncharacterized protein n=1 Tax=Paenibacillus kribbensis TaxID=172713 RepID=A0A222WJ58_9BACL|nr:hypothetical protein [Paenibacillus kribbensis]ASR46490.1 hypothetical protein B4V02_07260 [Paenibacillus kribbensis]MEC0234977.1 hypothetical protein [Paenibacillus kribbensis]